MVRAPTVIAIWTSSVLALLVGCGKVVYEEDGSGASAGVGQSASSHSAATGTTNSTGASKVTGPSATSSSTGFDQDACKAYCSALGVCTSNCLVDCATYESAPCAAEGAAIVACLTDHFDMSACQPTANSCDAAFAAWLACRPPDPKQCGGGGTTGQTSCGEDYFCMGGQFKVICTIGESLATCGCYVNSIQIGTCQTPPATMPEFDICSMEGTCCPFGTKH